MKPKTNMPKVSIENRHKVIFHCKEKAFQFNTAIKISVSRCAVRKRAVTGSLEKKNEVEDF